MQMMMTGLMEQNDKLLVLENIPFNMVNRTILKQSYNDSIVRNKDIGFSEFSIADSSFASESLELNKGMSVSLASKVLYMILNKLVNSNDDRTKIIIDLLFTHSIKENYIKKLLGEMMTLSKKLNIDFAIGNSAYILDKNKIVINALGIKNGSIISTIDNRKKYDLILVNYIGLFGTAYLIE